MSDRMSRREFVEIGGKAALGVGLLAAQLHTIGRAADAQISAQMRYVAPEARGTGSGENPEDAARWTDDSFWDGVEASLEADSVVVSFLGGTYPVSDQKRLDMSSLSLSKLGHDNHHLTLQGVSRYGVRITRHPSDSGKDGPGFLKLDRCRNVTLRHLNFTAPGDHRMSYSTQFDRCQDIVIDSCTWADIPNAHYAATGAQREESDGITYTNCRFVRIGSRTGAHMAYNAYASRRTSYINCYFEDCSGDYIRFRSGCDYNVIAGCTFRSTGKYTSQHMPFVSVPVFNVEGRGEVFGTHFLIFDNTFIYATDEKPETRIAIVFHHSGYDPPDRRHLLDAEDAKVLRSGSIGRKKALMKENLGLNADTIHVYRNSYRNVAHRGVYRCQAGYGAESRGGDGIYDISDTFNTKPVAATAKQALTYFSPDLTGRQSG